MVKVLTNLRIDEVSAVDKGAGRNVKIVLMKRASRPDATPMDTLKAFPNSTSFNAVLARMEAEELAKADHDDDDGGDRNASAGGLANHPVVQLATLLIGSGKFANYGDAFHHLLNTPSGAALLHRTRTHKAEKDDVSMSTLESILKDFGPVKLCKYICNTQRSPCSELELVASLSRYAGGDTAFAKLYANERDVREAVAIAKSASDTDYRPVLDFRTVTPGDFQPQVISGGEWWDEDDADQAWDKLCEIGRQMAPTATPEKQFAIAFEDPKNAALSARVHRRPPPMTNFPMPRDMRAEKRASEGSGSTDGAYAELMQKVEAYRDVHPELSIAQAFDKIYTDRANVELAKRERAESRPA